MLPRRTALMMILALALLPACKTSDGGGNDRGGDDGAEDGGVEDGLGEGEGEGEAGGGGGDGGGGEDGGDGGDPPPVVCTAEFQFEGGVVDADIRLVAACSPYVITERVDVREGATLKIDAGVEVQFGAGDWLRVGDGGPGKLVAAGTAEAPITLTSSDVEPTSASWNGVVLGAQVLSGTILEHVEVKWGGQDSLSAHRGCVTILSEHPGRVSIKDSLFSGCDQSAVAGVIAGFAFEEMSGNTFKDSSSGMWLHPSAVGSVAGGQTYDGVKTNEIYEGTLSGTATWAAQSVPWVLDNRMEVRGEDNPVLTLEAGVHVQTTGGGWIRVGDSEPGSLVADGAADNPVVFESSEPEPTSGGWNGLVFGPKVLSGAALRHTVVRHGGQDSLSAHKGCVTLTTSNPGRVSITDSTFELCDQASIAATANGVTFGENARNTFKDGDGMWLHPTAVGSVSGGQTYDDGAINAINDGVVPASATWHAQSAPWVVNNRVEVKGDDNPVLTLEAGITLQFTGGGWLRIGDGAAGSLVAAGTAEVPVILESNEIEPTPGGWNGIVFAGGTLSGASLSNTIVRHGGQDSLSAHKGCVTLTTDNPGRVSITDSTFEHCAQAGVAAHGNGVSFGTHSGNTYRSCGGGLWLHPTAVGSVSADQTFEDTPANSIIDGRLVDDATWGAQPVPWVVDNRVEVRGEAPEAVTLTVEAGATLHFTSGGWLRVGDGGDGGRLIVNGTADAPVTFDADGPEPVAGGWNGIVFLSGTLSGSLIDHARILHAGQDSLSAHKGGVTMHDTAAKVTVRNSTFQDNEQADLWHDCESTPTLGSNTYGTFGSATPEGGC